MVAESLKRRIQKLESKSTRQHLQIADILSDLAVLTKRIREVKEMVEHGEAL